MASTSNQSQVKPIEEISRNSRKKHEHEAKTPHTTFNPVGQLLSIWFPVYLRPLGPSLSSHNRKRKKIFSRCTSGSRWRFSYRALRKTPFYWLHIKIQSSHSLPVPDPNTGERGSSTIK